MNGTGQTYYNCSPLGTYSSVTAMQACQAYAVSIGQPTSNCSDGWECGCPHACAPPPTVCYQQGANVPYCWGYTSPTDQGWLENGTCPESGSQIGTWN
jgi:hypothetical protein